MKSQQKAIILIRGAGELASGAAWALTKAGYSVIMTEVEKPLMVRWPVCFGTAIEENEWTVEGIRAKKVKHFQECKEAWQHGQVPVIIDPYLKHLSEIKPDILVDAIMAKRNCGTTREMASFTIGLGPGFSAGDDVHRVIETNRGHDLGRLIYEGQAEPNTGIPGNIAGYTKERVVYSSQSGVFKAAQEIGEKVNPGDVLGIIQGEYGIESVRATIQGTLRGLLRDGTPVQAQVKVGDIDARGHKEYCYTLSEKSRMIGCAVLLAVSERYR